jgi:SAM-dependent methyltransferase
MSQTFHDHFSGIASRYADFRPHYPAALFDYLATLVPRNSLVWDCAAGSGQATVDLAERFDRVIASDASREQIGSAKPHPNVEYRVAPAEQSGLADGTVGLITVAQAVHWFDLDRFYAEARRVLRPGGILAVWGYGVDEVEGDAVNRIVLDYYENIVGPYWPPERKVIEEGYRTIPFPFTELTPPPFQLEENWTFEELLGYMSTWSSTTRYIKAKGEDPIEALSEKLLPEWGDPEKPRKVTWPLPLRVGRV